MVREYTTGLNIVVVAESAQDILCNIAYVSVGWYSWVQDRDRWNGITFYVYGDQMVCSMLSNLGVKVELIIIRGMSLIP